jgi:hypothetical protein
MHWLLRLLMLTRPAKVPAKHHTPQAPGAATSRATHSVPKAQPPEETWLEAKPVGPQVAEAVCAAEDDPAALQSKKEVPPTKVTWAVWQVVAELQAQAAPGAQQVPPQAAVARSQHEPEVQV